MTTLEFLETLVHPSDDQLPLPEAAEKSQKTQTSDPVTCDSLKKKISNIAQVTSPVHHFRDCQINDNGRGYVA